MLVSVKPDSLAKNIRMETSNLLGVQFNSLAWMKALLSYDGSSGTRHAFLHFRSCNVHASFFSFDKIQPGSPVVSR